MTKKKTFRKGQKVRLVNTFPVFPGRSGKVVETRFLTTRREQDSELVSVRFSDDEEGRTHTVHAKYLEPDA